MATYVMNYKIPTGTFQRPVQVKPSNELDTAHSSSSPNDQQTTSGPFFLQRPTISSDLASRLIPIDVDLHTKKNAEEHLTKHYDIPGLVLRRGKSFSFTVTFNREFDPEQYQLYVRLATGPRSMISKGTQIRMLVNDSPNENGWSAKTIPPEHDAENKNQVSLQVHSPSNAIVSKYILLLEVHPLNSEEKKDRDQNLTLFLFEVDLYFLFNPWNKDDACALPSDEQISEYVLNEHGQIFLGTSDKPQQTPWYYGQFEKPALLAALNLLDKAQLPAQNRADPSVILRILSSRICSNPGTNSGIFPSALNQPIAAKDKGYTSSTNVLKQYIQGNYQTIQGGSGHNWQHAAVLCTLSRALGIPSRIVTVYNAACRTDGTENNDIHWNVKQRPLRRLNSDLICSAHVWNECWMRREDLSTNESEWQIIDSTPVQMCDGIRRAGPCSVSSIKKAQLGSRWDSPFFHSAIQGKKRNWIVYPDGNMKLLNVQKNSIGTKILTRSLRNEFEPEDLTDHYKSSTEEKSPDPTKDDVDFGFKAPEAILFGTHIDFEFTAKNKSNEKRTVTVAFTVCLVTSTGQQEIADIEQPIQTLNLEAEKDEHIQLKIPAELYINRSQEENILVKYYLNVQVKETDQVFLRDENIVFSKMDIIKPSLKEDVIEIGQPVLLQLQIANTFSRPINKARIYIDGLGNNQICFFSRTFAPNESTTVETNVYPKRIGVSRLYVTLISPEIGSSTQTIPLEILAEPLKVPDEPLLKTRPEKEEEVKNEEQKQDKPSVGVEEKPAPEIKLETVASENESENADDVEELYMKKKNNASQANASSNSSIPHGSTLSLDKDKISLDSLDIFNDRRHLNNN